MKKKTLPVLLLFASLAALMAEEIDDEYNDFGMAEGITIFGDFPPDSAEASILAKIGGLAVDRERFVKEDLLRDAGFQRNGNAKYRQTTGGEKTISVLRGVFHAVSLGMVPMKPFLEVEYERLPRGNFYRFDRVIDASPLKDLAPEVRAVMELEYMLQVEFVNGALVRGWNEKYYSPRNIAKFEELAASLPASPPSVEKLKNRYLNEELPRIKAALERFENPGEDYLQARRNFDTQGFLSP